MQTIIEYLALLLPLIVIVCILFLLLINIYLRIRRLIPVRVNCWFCNRWTKVHYDLQNSFECPACLQYNGFNLEGDYNKPIAAQYEHLLNDDVIYNKRTNNKSPIATNGLCLSCNNNVRLKVFQLANFVPLNENNFDAEIEHFEQQLDKSYKLCRLCESVVKTTLRKQNDSLGLKLPNLRKTGIRLLNFTNYSKNRRTFIIKAIGTILLTIAICNITYILTSFDYSNDSLKKITPEVLYPYVAKLRDTCVDSWKVVYDSFVATFSNHKSSYPLLAKRDVNFQYNAKLLCCLGALLQFILIFLSDDGRLRKVIQTVAWGLLMMFSWNSPVLNFNYNSYGQIFLNIVIIGSMCITWTYQIKPKKAKRKSSYKVKNAKNQNKRDVPYNTSDAQNIQSGKQQPEHFTEFTKPNFIPSINNFQSETYNTHYKDARSTLCNYSTNSIVEKPFSFQEDLISDLDKLNLGRSLTSQKCTSENPFLRIRSPPQLQNGSCRVWGSKSPKNGSNEFLMPTTPSSFILKVQFSTRNSKF